MNNRYLYRAKRCDTGEWVVGSYVYTFAPDKKCHVVGVMEENYWIVEENGNMVLVDKDTICQCTGLRDKNGKLIWENDIMVSHLDDRFPEDATYTRVVWNNNGFCTKEQGSDDIFPLDKFDQENFEVCGNLFDNPELLEK